MKKYLLFASLALNLVFVAKTLFGRWQNTFRFAPSHSVLFVGDSQTAFFSLPDSLHNAGAGGLTSVALLDRLPGLLTSQPRKLFLQIGINDLGNGHHPDSLLSRYRRILSHVRQASPATRVYVQSILPVVPGNSIYPDPVLNEKVAAVNRKLKPLCQAAGIAFIDLSALAPSGNLPASLSTDGVHLTPEAYRKWWALLLPHLRQ